MLRFKLYNLSGVYYLHDRDGKSKTPVYFRKRVKNLNARSIPFLLHHKLECVIKIVIKIKINNRDYITIVVGAIRHIRYLLSSSTYRMVIIVIVRYR